MAFGRGGFDWTQDEQPDMATINIVPLVDIMLVLLVVFMVAAPISISGIAIQLPESQAQGTGVARERIVLTIAADGSYYFDQQAVAAPDLQEQLTAIYSVRADKDLYIRADTAVAYGQVIAAMSTAKLAGVNKISMLTTAPTTEPRS